MTKEQCWREFWDKIAVMYADLPPDALREVAVPLPQAA